MLVDSRKRFFDEIEEREISNRRRADETMKQMPRCDMLTVMLDAC